MEKNEIVFVVVLFLFQQEICGRKTKRETRKNFLSMKNNRFGSLWFLPIEVDRNRIEKVDLGKRRSTENNRFVWPIRRNVSLVVRVDRFSNRE